MMTVPSGDIDVSTSFSAVPSMLDDRSLAKKMWGTLWQRENVLKGKDFSKIEFRSV